MALPAVGDGYQVGDGNTGETLLVGRSDVPVQIGGVATALVVFHGATTTNGAQAAFVTAVDGTGIASGLVGFATTAQALTLFTAVNSIRTVLINKGFMASS